jgi:hypothetical protein
MRFHLVRKALLALTICLLLVNAALNRSIALVGDGHEYALMSEALLTRASPELRIEDIDSVEADMRAARTTLQLPWANQLRDVVSNRKPAGYGYFLANNGHYYSYHFWLYPLLNVPALAAVKVLNLSPTLSFVLTNSAIVLATIGIILSCSRLLPVVRVGLAVLYALAGTTYYLNWSHPEILTFSFLLAGLITVGSSRYFLSALLLAAAAQHNPPVGLAAAAVLTYGLWNEALDWRRTGRFPFAGTARLLIATAMLVTSPLFFQILFGTPNLIKSTGYAVSSLISVDRLVSLYFDLNQGMVRSIPWVMALLVMLLMIDVFRRKWFDRRNWIGVLSLLALSVAMAVPCLMTINWNSGAVVVMRYAYWVSVPVVLALILLVAEMPRVALRVVLTVVIVGQLLLVTKFGIYGLDEVHIVHSRESLSAMKRFPHLISPVPEIFAERTQHYEGMQNDSLYLVVRNQRLKKVLVHGDSRYVQVPLCGVLIDTLESGVAVVPSELGWRYLNVDMPCAAEDDLYAEQNRYDPYDSAGIDFTEKGNARRYAGSGWSVAEPWGTWTEGKTAQMQIRLPQNIRGPAQLEIDAHAFMPPGATPQTVTVFTNGVRIAAMTWDGNDAIQTAIIPETVIAAADGKLLLRLTIENPRSPASARLSADARNLGLGVRRMRLSFPDNRLLEGNDGSLAGSTALMSSAEAH